MDPFTHDPRNAEGPSVSSTQEGAAPTYEACKWSQACKHPLGGIQEASTPYFFIGILQAGYA